MRRMDDLGRVVIPKEIRKNIGVAPGDPLEIYVTRDGEVVFKKYCLLKNTNGKLRKKSLATLLKASLFWLIVMVVFKQGALKSLR